MRSKQTDLDVSVYQAIKDAAKTYSQEQAKPKQNQNPRVAGLTRGTRTKHHAQPRSQNHPSLAGDGDTHSSGKKAKSAESKQDLRKGEHGEGWDGEIGYRINDRYRRKRIMDKELGGERVEHGVKSESNQIQSQDHP